MVYRQELFLCLLPNMHFSSYAAVAALLGAAAAAPANVQRHVLHEKRAVSENWAKGERLRPDVRMPIRIGLVQENLHKGHDWLMEV